MRRLRHHQQPVARFMRWLQLVTSDMGLKHGATQCFWNLNVRQYHGRRIVQGLSGCCRDAQGHLAARASDNVQQCPGSQAWVDERARPCCQKAQPTQSCVSKRQTVLATRTKCMLYTRISMHLGCIPCVCSLVFGLVTRGLDVDSSQLFPAAIL